MFNIFVGSWKMLIDRKGENKKHSAQVVVSMFVIKEL